MSKVLDRALLSLFLGIDISKEKFDACCIGSNGDKLFRNVGLSKISKRGNRHLRRIIWLMTVKVIQFEGYFWRYFEQRIKDGLLYKKAVLATAHKLIRVIFAMLSNKTLFNAKVR